MNNVLINRSLARIGGHCRQGFTLIELLTVIAILGILAAILIPVVSRARESARAAQCSGQVRELGVAMHLYAGDHGRFPSSSRAPYPPAFAWLFQLHEYLLERELEHFWENDGDSIFFCPTAVSNHNYSPMAASTYAPNHYLLSDYWHSVPSDAVRTPEWPRDPSIMAMIGESRFGGGGSRSIIGPLHDGQHLPGAIHNGFANIAFADGHVGRVDPTTLPLDASDPFWGRVQN